ncbi:MAG: phosphonate ABC transporter, permease protein PhnE, partial [Dehalococcoidia bacterium]
MAILGRTLKRSPQTPDMEALRTQLLQPLPRIGVKTVLIILATVGVLYWGIVGSETSPAELIDGLPSIWNFLTRLMPPEFEHDTKTIASPAILFIPSISTGISYPYPTILDAVRETIQMAIVGTLLALFLAIPFALLASRNLAPPAVYTLTRFLLNANRAVPDIIFALMFVAAVGLGPFGGVLALAVGSMGSIAKVYAESIEAIDPQQVLAVKATGASRAQTIAYSVAPQAMPMIASYSLLQFEVNVRSATILGVVGAGGVGFELQKYMSLFQYHQLMGALVIIIVVV